jgi:hypothetical protein
MSMLIHQWSKRHKRLTRLLDSRCPGGYPVVTKGNTPRAVWRPLFAEGVRARNLKFVCALGEAQALAYAHFTRVCGSGQSVPRATGVQKTPMKERAGAQQ